MSDVRLVESDGRAEAPRGARGDSRGLRTREACASASSCEGAESPASPNQDDRGIAQPDIGGIPGFPNVSQGMVGIAGGAGSSRIPYGKGPADPEKGNAGLNPGGKNYIENPDYPVEAWTAQGFNMVLISAFRAAGEHAETLCRKPGCCCKQIEIILVCVSPEPRGSAAALRQASGYMGQPSFTVDPATGLPNFHQYWYCGKREIYDCQKSVFVIPQTRPIDNESEYK